MYCINCGSKIKFNEKFCTCCGKPTQNNKGKPGVSWWKILFLIILTIIVSSLFWASVYGTSDDQAVNSMTHMLETIGRQKQAWEKSETIVAEFAFALSEECLYSASCIEESANTITILRAEIDKEAGEIDKLWSEETVGKDFGEYFSGLTERNQQKLLDVLNVYFPEEKEELRGIEGELL